ncbi:unnamed protein product (macronuclear) [Paramecium tetraurelia]|uniref:Golgi apparatus membrane protein TVP23 homolog n=1 Tax=Paramecium tetraurelia TaxID=5888 RepID=A0DPZ1_PARTE|nr:uncharacterized protein GSPATT00002507001 [Paramecium tetraurelia]CAK85108.1 unnamed protein product [Paramecium tetraurelia]|eukprot:XP_001452505.1 hypothetical protein (macronuclear) [Paramecium tetraurelia strain d4-2]
MVRTSFSYFNPVTFLFPELLSNGKIDLTKTVDYVAIVIHILFKIIIVALFILELKNFFFEQLMLMIIILTSLNFWVVKNYTGKKLIGIVWWNCREEQDVWYFEKVNKLYPLNKYCQYYFWYCLYVHEIFLFFLLIFLAVSQKWKQFIIILIPTFENFSQTLIYSHAIKDNEIFRYLQDLTEYRLRRSIKCQFTFNLKQLPFKLQF